MPRPRTNQVTPGQIIGDLRGQIGHFEPDPYLALGNTDSTHEVFFGRSNGIGELAVKPFVKLGRATGEEQNLAGVRNLGFDAIEPVGVVSGGLAHYLLTFRRPGLTNLGQVDWRAGIASPRLGGVLKPTLNTVAETVADWHNAGITHGDLRPKNAMFDRDGRPVFGDAERTRIGQPTAQLTEQANRDMSVLGAGFLTKGLLADRSTKFRIGYVRDTFLVPYLAAADPGNFNMDPDAREKAIVDYWLADTRTKGVRPRPVASLKQVA